MEKAVTYLSLRISMVYDIEKANSRHGLEDFCCKFGAAFRGGVLLKIDDN